MIPRISRSSSQGFGSILAAILLFLVCVIAVTVLASFVLRTSERRASTGSMNREIYEAIVGNPELGTFGYIGDVGDYPANLADLLQVPSTNPPGWNGPYVRNVLLNSSGVLMDPFFGPLEYWRSIGVGAAEPSTHGVVIISRGRDHASSNASLTPNDGSTGFLGTLPTASGYATTPDNVDNQVVPDIHVSKSAINVGYTGTLTVNLKNWDTQANALVDGCPMAHTIEVTSDPRGANDRMTIAMGSSLSMQLIQGSYTIRLAANSNTNQSFYTESVTVLPAATTTRTIRTNTVNTNTTPTFNLRVFNSTGANLTVRNKYGATDLATVAMNATGSAAMRACGVVEAWTGAGGTGTLLDTWVMPNASYTRTVSNLTSTVRITNAGGTAARRQILFTVGTIGITGIPHGTVYKLRRQHFTVPRNSRIRTFDNTGLLLSNVAAVGADQGFNY